MHLRDKTTCPFIYVFVRLSRMASAQRNKTGKKQFQHSFCRNKTARFVSAKTNAKTAVKRVSCFRQSQTVSAVYAKLLLSIAQIPLGSTRLDSTRHIRRVEPMHFGCVELVEQHSSTRSTRRARLARHVEHDWLDWLDKVERVESSRVESSQVEFEPKGM